jgi:hypothetical protein
VLEIHLSPHILLITKDSLWPVGYWLSQPYLLDKLGGMLLSFEHPFIPFLFFLSHMSFIRDYQSV